MIERNVVVFKVFFSSNFTNGEAFVTGTSYVINNGRLDIIDNSIENTAARCVATFAPDSWSAILMITNSAESPKEMKDENG